MMPVKCGAYTPLPHRHGSLRGILFLLNLLQQLVPLLLRALYLRLQSLVRFLSLFQYLLLLLRLCSIVRRVLAQPVTLPDELSGVEPCRVSGRAGPSVLHQTILQGVIKRDERNEAKVGRNLTKPGFGANQVSCVCNERN